MPKIKKIRLHVRNFLRENRSKCRGQRLIPVENSRCHDSEAAVVTTFSVIKLIIVYKNNLITLSIVKLVKEEMLRYKDLNI